MAANVDFVEVGRMAHELANRHGRNSHQHAARMAEEALADGKTDEADFWKAVEHSLKPRTKGTGVREE